jgi:hypothetical protein
LSSLECDGLSFTKVVETSLSARGVVKEVLVPITGQDETEPFVSDEAFDCAFHGCHGDLLEIRVMTNVRAGRVVGLMSAAAASRPDCAARYGATTAEPIPP